MSEHRYQLSDRITLTFTGRSDDGRPDVWIVERPGPDGVGGQVRLTTDEWERLVDRIPHIRALAK